MIELSLFDGISAGQVAMNRIGVTPTKYYAAEVDKFAIKCTQANFPNTIQLGDVTKWREWDIDWSEIDLVTGGFPCQAWSMAGKQLGDKDERGMLFWTMLDIMKHVRYHNPKADFLIENVKMKKEFEEYITYHTENALGEVHKVLINSALVSAQNRQRYYWTSKPVCQPEDKGLILADVLESNPQNITVMSDKFTTRNARILRDSADGKAKNLSAMEYVKNGRQGDYINVKCGRVVGRKINPETGKRDDYNPDLKAVQRFEPRLDERSGTLTTVQKDNVLMYVNDNERVKAISENDRGYRPHKDDKSKSGISELGRILKPTASKTDTVTTSHSPKLAVNCDIENLKYRKLTPMECERLQTFPDGYTAMLSNTQRYKTLGNSWTVDVICHIFKEMGIK
ncbi:C-5 cytosine-specific DNA methylase [Vibrio phage 1.239.O._10N.261.52.F6]|nr:C-5 cytosine-specific DNA methylase [Vibrio phage 1.239.O._10N.261.52.F6]